MSNEWSHVGVRLAGSLRRRLERLAEDQSTSISELVRRSVQIYLSGGAGAWERRQILAAELGSDPGQSAHDDPEFRACGEWMQSLPEDVRGCVLRIGTALETSRTMQPSERPWRELTGVSSALTWCAELRPPIPLDLDEDGQVARLLRDSVLVECTDAWAGAGSGARSALTGFRLGDLYPAEAESGAPLLRAFLRSGCRLENRVTEIRDGEGQRRWAIASLVGIRDAGLLVSLWSISLPLTPEIARDAAQALLGSDS